MTALIPIDFRSDRILLIEEDGEPFVPMRPICDALGLAWQPQHRKLTSGDRNWLCHHMVTQMPGDDQTREVTCLPLVMLPAWLFSISPARVKPELREKLTAYQAECAQVLWNHFSVGKKAMQAELATLERHHRHMASYLLAANPLWGKIAHLLDAGTYRGHVWRHLNKPEMQVATIIEDMERVGVISRHDWRPSMFGIEDGPAPSKALAEDGAHGR